MQHGDETYTVRELTLYRAHLHSMCAFFLPPFRREQILSDFSVGVRRSPRLSQRYSQPPELTSSHPLVESRRSLRSTASVGPPSILNESGQSVPPSFYDNESEDHMQTVTEDTLRSYTSQQGLPKHLYGMSRVSTLGYVNIYLVQ